MKNEYDVIIVGGGAAGLSLAITLGSAQEHFEWAQSKKVMHRKQVAIYGIILKKNKWICITTAYCKIKDSCIILPSDCTHNNRVYHDGEARSAECDQTCTCDKGNWKCVMAPGSSCCKEGDKLYHNGESYPASDGCNTCTCNNGHANCTMMLCLPLP
ncbi:MAG: hypothetical protein DSZ21_00685 [Tenericutes bacterium]|nr:MAG: hypothetical protein DSZ21_00685 [Mycoplasmatota bacterium]